MPRGWRKPLLTAAVAVGVPLFFYGVFERWFLVPLPKGPIARDPDLEADLEHVLQRIACSLMYPFAKRRKLDRG